MEKPENIGPSGPTRFKPAVDDNDESALNESKIYYTGLVPPELTSAFQGWWTKRMGGGEEEEERVCANVLLHCLTIYCFSWKQT